MPDKSETDKRDEWWRNAPPDEFLKILDFDARVGFTAVEGMVQLLFWSPALEPMMDTEVIGHLTLRQILEVISENRSKLQQELVAGKDYGKAYARGEIPSKTRKIAALQQIVRREVDLYNAESYKAQSYAILDDEQGIYAVITVPDERKDRPAWAIVMARVIGEYVVIDEDTTDKPLVDALMINGGIARDKIILAYAGETLPEAKPHD